MKYLHKVSERDVNDEFKAESEREVYVNIHTTNLH